MAQPMNKSHRLNFLNFERLSLSAHCIPSPGIIHKHCTHINLSVEKLLATAHSGANIPECGETPSNNSLRHTLL